LAEGARRGLDALAQWTKPADLSDGAFAAMRKQMTAVFNSALRQRTPLLLARLCQ
jgi:hypothetical protein